jgi:outer membrane lipoprotein-sorting protein
MKFSALATALCLTSLLASPTAAAHYRYAPSAAGGAYAAMAVDANKILVEVDKRAAGFVDQRYTAKMEILKGGEHKKTLVFEAVMRGLDQQLIVFTNPGDVAGMKVLMQDPTTLYVYLPDFKKVRRVAAHAMNQGFLGSEFTYEDMTQVKLSPFYDAELGGKEGSETTLVLKLKKDVEATYPKLEVVIDSKKGGVTVLRYFDKTDKVVREQHRDDWKKVGGNNVPTKISVTNLKTGNATIITLSDLAVNQGVDESVFSRRELLRG